MPDLPYRRRTGTEPGRGRALRAYELGGAVWLTLGVARPGVFKVDAGSLLTATEARDLAIDLQRLAADLEREQSHA